MLHPAQRVAAIAGRQARRKHGRERHTEIGLAPDPRTGARHQTRQQLGLRDQELRQQIATRAEAEQSAQHLAIFGQELDEPDARARRRQKALELVQRLVGIRALPDLVQQRGIETLERLAHGAGVRNERTPLDDQLQIVARALRVAKPRRAQRNQTRWLEPPRARRLGLGEKFAERPVHVARHAPVVRRERAGGDARGPGESEPPCETPELDWLTRQRVRLQLVEDLQTVLDGPQMHVRMRERPSELRHQVAALGQAKDRLERVTLPQPRVVAAVQELERLHEELDLANAAASQLDVELFAALRLDRSIDLTLHRPDGDRDPGIDAGPVDHVARQLGKARADALVAGRDARLQQRLAFPELRPLAVVGAIAVEREHHRPRAPLGSESQVNPEQRAFLGDVLELRHDGPAHALEVRAVGQATGSSAIRLTIGAVHEHQVDVRRVVQLLAAELPHRDDGHPGLGAVRVPRRAVLRARGVLRHLPDGPETDVDHARQFLGRHDQIGIAQQIARADPEKVAVLEPAQRIHARVARRDGTERGREIRGELLREPGAHRRRLEEPREEARAPAQRVGEELARAGDRGDQLRGAGVLRERAEEDRAVRGRRDALQVVERHVGVR